MLVQLKKMKIFKLHLVLQNQINITFILLKRCNNYYSISAIGSYLGV